MESEEAVEELELPDAIWQDISASRRNHDEDRRLAKSAYTEIHIGIHIPQPSFNGFLRPAPHLLAESVGGQKKCDPSQQIGLWDGRRELEDNLREDKMTADEPQQPEKVVGIGHRGNVGEG